MSESTQRPRSPRVPVEFALDVEGTDASGKTFQAKAKATKISRGGATLQVDVDVPIGSTVKLVPPFGGKLTAEVNGSWIDDIDGNRRIVREHDTERAASLARVLGVSPILAALLISRGYADERAARTFLSPSYD